MTTPKGRATRDRIVATAAALMYERGVAGTSTEDVQAAAGVSASQLYHYFADKRSLTRAVIDYQADAILGFQESMLARVDSLDGLRNWAAAIVDIQRSNGFRGGCPLASLGSELAESDSAAREDVEAGYQRWQAAIRSGLAAIRDRGGLVDSADIDQLATALLTSLQGGLLLAKVQRDGTPLKTALSTAIDHVATFAAA
ncbi:transcriptional regulator [Mycolicibacterium canariasense]|uniref:Transcriptional regulator n=1 Tax=Mycolicibacterium canariasense TaxID=228230 RepID=A0A100W9Q3_MYCCR|nr:TetR/AcrR family transcriptional regulator [Mycolicibacterium canariasense]MCV7208846.1 TetR/AcrR family transcriptional regulator [Mycolicibacterium canariasense]ORV07091.1 TetR family transcriptional regulator [Mycolicibacterium canariasense]GAS94364.1 transcriptional regulator [Mycolicibacterium canariasense]